LKQDPTLTISHWVHVTTWLVNTAAGQRLTDSHELCGFIAN